MRRVSITKEEEEGYYYGFSNEGMWPLCHITHTRPIFCLEDWKSYQKVNQKFANILLEEIKDEKNPLVLLIRLSGIHYIANHGFEIFSPYIRWIHPEAKLLMSILRKANKELQKKLSLMPGIFLENKRMTLSIHYRNVSVSHIPAIKQAVRSVVFSHFPELKITYGKKVLEIRPNILWDKGYAVLKLLESRDSSIHALPVYLGDDRTDEDAFYRLNSRGITIRVGKFKSTSAQYFLKNTHEVKRFLEGILTGNSPY